MINSCFSQFFEKPIYKNFWYHQSNDFVENLTSHSGVNWLENNLTSTTFTGKCNEEPRSIISFVEKEPEFTFYYLFSLFKKGSILK